MYFICIDDSAYVVLAAQRGVIKLTVDRETWDIPTLALLSLRILVHVLYYARAEHVHNYTMMHQPQRNSKHARSPPLALLPDQRR